MFGEGFSTKERLDDKVEVERFTLNSSKPFDQVVAALNSAVRMASLLAPYQNAAALNVARELDAKVEALLASAAA